MSQALNELKELIKEDLKIRYPKVPDHAQPINIFGAMKPEKREKKRIEKFCDLKGHNIVIIENRGQRRVTDNSYTDAIGGEHNIKVVEWIGSGMKQGIADLQGSIRGRSVAIELKRKYKVGQDRMSQAQMEFKARQERDGGVYVIVDSFESFYEWYNDFIKS